MSRAQCVTELLRGDTSQDLVLDFSCTGALDGWSGPTLPQLPNSAVSSGNCSGTMLGTTSSLEREIGMAQQHRAVGHAGVCRSRTGLLTISLAVRVNFLVLVASPVSHRGGHTMQGSCRALAYVARCTNRPPLRGPPNVGVRATSPSRNSSPHGLPPLLNRFKTGFRFVTSVPKHGP